MIATVRCVALLLGLALSAACFASSAAASADGVVWTVDSLANLDAFDATSGQPLTRRALSVDAGAPVTNLTSTGVAIAEHELLVAAGGVSYTAATGYVIAYGVP